MRYVFGDYTLDIRRYELLCRGQAVKLRPKVFQVLAYLIAHRDRVVSKDELLEQVWPNQFIGDGSLNACLMAVRKAVGDSGQSQRYIQTLHGRGYRFVAAVEEQAQETTQHDEPAVPSTPPEEGRPDAAAVWSEGNIQPCPVCRHTNPAAALFCNACASPLTRAALHPPEMSQDPPRDTPAQARQPFPAATTRMPEASRRQLTVLVCDLVDSTHLAGQLDPEEFREVVRAYHHVCAEVIQRFDGSIAQSLSDRLLAYFGYPLAHEDTAQRAVRAGLGILAALRTRLPGLEHKVALPLAVRIGIHTGLVVMDAIGAGAWQAPLALGQTPNIASRLQRLAAPDSVVISAATYRLIHGYFLCEPLGPYTLSGVTQPLDVYRVLQESGAQSHLDVAMTRGLTPLVGREAEVTLLLERWTQVTEGMGQVVMLSGEAGIGKSRLVQVLKDRVAREGHALLECRGSPYYQHSMLYPIIDLLQRLLQWHQDDAPEAKLAKLEQRLRQDHLVLAETVPLLAALLMLPIPADRYPPLLLSPERQRHRTLETILALILARATQKPLLFIVEDLHWIDPSTLELLRLVIDQGPTASLYTLLTCRPTFQPPWGFRAHLTPLGLARLPRPQVEIMIEHVASGTALPAEVRQQLVEKTDGVPLFIEEMTKAVLESEGLREQHGHDMTSRPWPALAVPPTLQDSLMARLDRLDTAKGAAQLGATIGREFSYALLKAVAQVEEASLQQELKRLVEAELLYQRGVAPQATYVFKHALIQEAAYQSLLKQTRQRYHQRLVEVLKAQCRTVVATQPELLAHHATEAGLLHQAIGYWQRAGEHAFQRGAHQEAAGHFRQGLALVQTLPDSPERRQYELDVHIALGPIFMVLYGVTAPEVERVYARAYAFCQQVEATPQLFAALRGLCHFYHTRGQLQTARELAERLIALAQSRQDTSLAMEAHMVWGLTLYRLGEFVPALTHLEQGLAHRRAATSQDLPDIPHPELACLLYSGCVLWYLGYPDQARTRIHAGLARAQQSAYPHQHVWGQHLGAIFYQFCREAGAADELAEMVVTASLEQGFQICLPEGIILQGWAMTQRGQGEAGIVRIRQGITDYHTRGGESGLIRYYTLLAEVYGTLGQAEEGLAALAEAQALVEKTGEYLYEAELYRVKGELLLVQEKPNTVEAEACLYHALHTARRQQAKSLELRAAMRLSRLWQQQGEREEARDLLAPIYGWFTEGFDTADLQEAKALLGEFGA